MELKILSVIDEMSDDAVQELSTAEPLQDSDTVIGEVPMRVRKMIHFVKENRDPVGAYFREVGTRLHELTGGPSALSLQNASRNLREIADRAKRNSRIAKSIVDLITMELDAEFGSDHAFLDIRQGWKVVIPAAIPKSETDVQQTEEMLPPNCGDPNCLVHGHLNQRSRVDLFDI